MKMMSMDPKEVARHRSKLYFESEMEKAQGVMKNEVAEKNGWIRSSFEAGYLDAAIPLETHLNSQEARYEAEIDMLKEQLKVEREARLYAERRAAEAAQLPLFVNFPSRKGGDVRIRLDQIAAVTKDKVYLVTDDVPFADMQDPREVLEAITLEIAKTQHEAPSVEIGAGAMNFGHD